MVEWKDIKDIDKETVLELVNYRTRIFENLARDGLALLSIQLLILPITLSAASLLLPNNESLPTEGVIRLLIASLSSLTAIFLSVDSYYFCRRKATAHPNLIRDVLEIPERKGSIENTHRYARRTLRETEAVHSYLWKRIDFLGTRLPDEVRLTSEFNTFDEAHMRSRLLLSIILTIVSIVIVLSAFITPLTEGFDIIVILVIGVSSILYITLRPLAGVPSELATNTSFKLLGISIALKNLVFYITRDGIRSLAVSALLIILPVLLDYSVSLRFIHREYSNLSLRSLYPLIVSAALLLGIGGVFRAIIINHERDN